jgi:hypothetical protein
MIFLSKEYNFTYLKWKSQFRLLKF